MAFTFTVDGVSYTGYQFEIEGTGQDFVVLPSDVPPVARSEALKPQRF